MQSPGNARACAYTRLLNVIESAALESRSRGDPGHRELMISRRASFEKRESDEANGAAARVLFLRACAS